MLFFISELFFYIRIVFISESVHKRVLLCLIRFFCQCREDLAPFAVTGITEDGVNDAAEMLGLHTNYPALKYAVISGQLYISGNPMWMAELEPWHTKARYWHSLTRSAAHPTFCSALSPDCSSPHPEPKFGSAHQRHGSRCFFSCPLPRLGVPFLHRSWSCMRMSSTTC